MSYFNRIKELLNSSHSTFHVVDLLKKDLEEKYNFKENFGNLGNSDKFLYNTNLTNFKEYK